MIILTVWTSAAQDRQISRGDKEFNRYDFVQAQSVYLKVAEKGFESAELFNKLGDSYYLNAQYPDAVNWYGKLIEKFPDEADAELYFRYATSLKAVKDYDKADEMLTKFFELKNVDRRAQLYSGNKNYLESIEARRKNYEVKKLDINSNYSDFGPYIYDEKLLFSSTRDTGTFLRRSHKWNAQPFLDFYEIGLEDLENGSTRVKKFNRRLNTKYHESTPSFTDDDNTIYFTRNNFNKRNYGIDDRGTNKLKIYRATKGSSSKWGNAEELPFCSDDYSTAHPALSPDGKTLYFSSDRPGSIGESDIWKVAINDDGSFGEPENLGEPINTEGRETFPFVTSNNEIYFASNGHQGLGGLDLFYANLNSSDPEIINLGEPLNTPQDDFSLVLDEDSRKGFFASNRNTVGGNDDIYSFTEVPCDITLAGLITDKDSGVPLTDVDMSFYDGDNNLITTLNTGNESSYDYIPGCGDTVVVKAAKEGYIPAEKVVIAPRESANLDQPLQLELEEKPFEIGDDLGKILNLNPIYFDFDRYNIRPDAALELAKIIAVMEEYPALKIDVRSHTDSRANDDYNAVLSQNRNDSTIRYIIEQGGIASSRLTGRGYGESQLINECSNGVDCTEEDHQLNRRSEFIIVEN